MRAREKRLWPSTVGSAILAALLCAVVSACQVLSPLTTAATKAAGALGQVTGAKVALQSGSAARDPHTLHGRVDFSKYHTLATGMSPFGPPTATLTLTNLSLGVTVATGQTDSSGNFNLPLTNFSASIGSMFMLESSYDLTQSNGSQGGGSGVARYRTFLEWTSSGWASTASDASGNIYLNADSTALAVVSSLDPSNVSSLSTIGMVTGCNTACTIVSPSANYTTAYLYSLAGAISDYLSRNFDPIESSSATSSTITQIYPHNPVYGGALMIKGTGFSPDQTMNAVSFGGYPATVFMASANMLGVWVPTSGQAPNQGNITVENTLLGITSNAIPYNLGSLAITSVTPDSANAGDTVMIRGTGFENNSETSVAFTTTSGTISAAVTYLDGNTLLAIVPSSATSGAVQVTVRGDTAGYNFTCLDSGSITAVANVNGYATITGTGFGDLGPQSQVYFNGLPSPNIVSWTGSSIVAEDPLPSLTASASGYVSVVNTGVAAKYTTAVTNVTSTIAENFSTIAHEDKGTSASWDTASHVLQAGSFNIYHNQGYLGNSGFNENSSSGLLLTPSSAQLADSGSFAHTGLVSNPTDGDDNAGFQLGIDSNYLYVSSGQTCWGGSAPTIYQYALGTDALVSSAPPRRSLTSPWTSVDEEIYDPMNDLYVLGNYCDDDNILTLGSNEWETANYINTSGGHYTPYLASGYPYYFLLDYFTGQGALYPYNALAAPSYQFGGVSDREYTSAAGFSWDPTFFLKTTAQGTGAISNLETIYASAAGLTGTANFPYPFTASNPISPPTGGVTVQIGSDGTYLYVLGNNPNYNNGANSIFRFEVNTSLPSSQQIDKFDGYSTTTPGTMVTSAYAAPPTPSWDTVYFTYLEPQDTTLTIKAYDATTQALLAEDTPATTSAPPNAAYGTFQTAYFAISDPSDDPVYLEADFSTTNTALTPILQSWYLYTGNFDTNSYYALSTAYDSGTNFPTYLTPTVTSTNPSNAPLEYSDSADDQNWSSWTPDVTTLRRRYIRFEATITGAETITGVSIPYEY